MKIFVFIILIGILSGGGLLSRDVVDLSRRDLFPEGENGEIFKTGVDLKCHGEWIYVVDHFHHRVLRYQLDKTLKFVDTIGTKGLGPGDLLFPLTISIWNNTLVINDRRGFSFFTLSGEYIKKYKDTSSYFSSTFCENKIFTLSTDGESSHFIQNATTDGKVIGLFGRKLFPLNYGIVKRLNASQVETYIYRGFLLADSKYIYYINIRFGNIIKYTLSGKEIARGNISGFFGENGQKKVQKNAQMFLEEGFDPLDKKTQKIRIRALYLFSKAAISDKCIYLLSDSYNYVDNKNESFIEIISIDKHTFSLNKKYRTKETEEPEKIYSFDVKTKGKSGKSFIVAMSSLEGNVITELSPDGKD